MRISLRALLCGTALAAWPAPAQDPQSEQIEALITESGQVQVCSRTFAPGQAAELIAAIRHCPRRSVELPRQAPGDSVWVTFMPLPGSGGTPPPPPPHTPLPVTRAQERTLERLGPLLGGNDIVIQQQSRPE